ncbi:MAG: UTP--glucose-1-phosphate uridylyltransferase, partial [Acidimicrobiia bacterium]
MARRHVGNDPFVVLLGDDIMIDTSTVLEEMIAVHERTGSSVLSCKEFPPDQISLYGCVDYEPAGDRLLRVKSII